jgi:mannosyltransferase
MATIAAPGFSGSSESVGLRSRVAQIPLWLKIAGLLILLIIPSLILRTQYINGQYWMDEGLAVGISSHPLTAIPGILKHDGSPPLYYMLLHVWMSMFGDSEAATHSLSLLFGTLTIPVGLWAGWSLHSRRTGVFAGVLFAFNPFLTEYSQETRMYSLMVLLGLLATIGFVQGFLFRRRKYIVLFVICQALMLYTHAWGIFYGASSLITLALIYRYSEDRTNLIRDGVKAYVAVGVLFLPWVPIFIYQAIHTAAPWDVAPRWGTPIQLARNVLGGDREAVALVFAMLVGLGGLFVRRGRRTFDGKLVWTMLGIWFFTLLLAWWSSQITAAWTPRYFAPIVGAMLLVIAVGLTRAGLVGVVALALSVLFSLNQAVYSPKYKSDMSTVGSQMGPLMHPGNLVIVGQPEETPLAYYYLPAGLEYANTAGGRVQDPTYMNWVNALQRLKSHDYRTIAQRLLNDVPVGGQILYIRPLTEGVASWGSPWTALIRRRSAQWAAIIRDDKQFVKVAVAPDNYAGSCCVSNSAILFRKVS